MENTAPGRPPAVLRYVGVVLLLSAACSGSAGGGAKASGDVDSFEFDRSLAEEQLDDAQPDTQHKKAMASLVQQDAAGAPDGRYALLGARRDLRLAPSVTQARCQCLGVVVGPPNAAGLSWQGQRPSINPESQVVLGLGSEGIPCDANPRGHVASYRGYTVEGPDVVVTVEIARAGRPVTSGAILPRPDGGQIYLRPRGADVPFGRGLDGAPRCSVAPSSTN